MDGTGQLIAVIGVLWTALTGIVAAVLRYLLNENKDLKAAIKDANSATTASNETNAKLAAILPGVLAENEALKRRTSTPVAEDRS